MTLTFFSFLPTWLFTPFVKPFLSPHSLYFQVWSRWAQFKRAIQVLQTSQFSCNFSLSTPSHYKEQILVDNWALSLDEWSPLVNLWLKLHKKLLVRYTLFFCRMETWVKYPVKMHFLIETLLVWRGMSSFTKMSIF